MRQRKARSALSSPRNPVLDQRAVAGPALHSEPATRQLGSAPHLREAEMPRRGQAVACGEAAPIILLLGPYANDGGMSMFDHVGDRLLGDAKDSQAGLDRKVVRHSYIQLP